MVCLVIWPGIEQHMIAEDAEGRTDDVQQRVLDQIDVWRKQLVDLSRRNRLLYFRRTKASTLEILREPDDVDP